MGRWHARAVEKASGVVVTVVDPDLARARAIANDAIAVPSVSELGALGGLDVVHVCTPVSSHADVVRAAVDLGAHVIVEKPLAASAATTHRLLQLSDAAGRMVVPVHQFLFQPGMQALARRSDELGRLVRCAFVAASAGSETTEIAPNELVADVLPHPLSLFARLVRHDLAHLDWHVVQPTVGELRAVAVAGTTSLEIVLTARGRPRSPRSR